MSDEKNRMEEASAHDREARHPFALGVLTGTVVGVGVGLLFAPRVGAQMRNEIGHQWTRAKGSCSTSYHRAKDTASQWSERGRRAYDATRTKVVHGAHETALGPERDVQVAHLEQRLRHGARAGRGGRTSGRPPH